MDKQSGGHTDPAVLPDVAISPHPVGQTEGDIPNAGDVVPEISEAAREGDLQKLNEIARQLGQAEAGQ
jgi:hypothetical protein